MPTICSLAAPPCFLHVLYVHECDVRALRPCESSLLRVAYMSWQTQMLYQL